MTQGKKSRDFRRRDPADPDKYEISVKGLKAILLAVQEIRERARGSKFMIPDQDYRALNLALDDIGKTLKDEIFSDYPSALKLAIDS